jgi:hypothetical protein
MSRTCIISGADALVRSRPPGRLLFSARAFILREKSGTRASRADQGVRPTINAESHHSGNVSDIEDAIRTAARDASACATSRTSARPRSFEDPSHASRDPEFQALERRLGLVLDGECG